MWREAAEQDTSDEAHEDAQGRGGGRHRRVLGEGKSAGRGDGGSSMQGLRCSAARGHGSHHASEGGAHQRRLRVEATEGSHIFLEGRTQYETQ